MYSQNSASWIGITFPCLPDITAGIPFPDLFPTLIAALQPFVSPVPDLFFRTTCTRSILWDCFLSCNDSVKLYTFGRKGSAVRV